MARLRALIPLLLAANATAAAQVPAARPLSSPPTEFAEPFSSVSEMVELRDGRVLLYDTREKRLGVAEFGDGTFREVARQGKGQCAYPDAGARWPACAHGDTHRRQEPHGHARQADRECDRC